MFKKAQIQKIQNSNSGFTTVELVVGIIVGAILVLSVSVVLVNLSRTNARARDLAVANAAIENKAESLRSQGFLALSALGDGTYNWDASEIPDDLTQSSGTYTIDSTLEPGLLQIQLELTYNDQGPLRTLEYSTYITELGVGQ